MIFTVIQAIVTVPRRLDVPSYVDDRGVLWQIIETAQQALPRIARLYMVTNFDPGTVRGFHLHRKEWKAFFVAKGSAKFATHPEDAAGLDVFVLTEKKPALLVVPPGFFNGWRALEERTLLLGLSSATIEESMADDERVDPYRFGDCWQVLSR